MQCKTQPSYYHLFHPENRRGKNLAFLLLLPLVALGFLGSEYPETLLDQGVFPRLFHLQMFCWKPGRKKLRIRLLNWWLSLVSFFAKLVLPVALWKRADTVAPPKREWVNKSVSPQLLLHVSNSHPHAQKSSFLFREARDSKVIGKTQGVAIQKPQSW